jgi:hypothetical protein
MYSNMGDMSDSDGDMSAESGDDEVEEKARSVISTSSSSRRSSRVRGKTASTTSNNEASRANVSVEVKEDEGEEEEEEDDEEFVGEEELDDESTMIEAEAEGAGKSSAEELATLKEESEMSIEQLRAMYSNMGDMSDSDGDVSEGSSGGFHSDNEEGKQSSKSVTFTNCSTVALASKSLDTMKVKDGEEDGEEGALDVDGAMQRLERADLQARSIHVSIIIMLMMSKLLLSYHVELLISSGVYVAGGLPFYFEQEAVAARVPACRAELAGVASRTKTEWNFSRR